MIMTKETITYDQPLNEIVRVALRLEQVFSQIDHQLADTSEQGTRMLINAINNALQILDRPDLKAKLAKELSQLQASLSRYQNIPVEVTNQLETLTRLFIDSSGKIGHRLRDIELLNALRLHLATPGGGCSFDFALYHYWLAQPVQVRQQIIADWLVEFREIRAAMKLILLIVRNSAKTEEKIAVHGFYQELLDAQSHLRMIRIHIARDIPAYPEMSIGRHFMSVRFFIPDILKRATQYPDNLHFWIGYCNP